MADRITKEQRSAIMSKIRSEDTMLEKKFFKLVSSELYCKGLRYRKHYSALPGKPDLAFIGKKIAIFVDGDFWHGYNLTKLKKKLPKKYWVPKILRNVSRDKEVNKILREMGWNALRFWEHDVNESPRAVVARVARALQV